jgi:hypothetical protein
MRNQLIQKLGLMLRGTVTDNRSLYTTPFLKSVITIKTVFLLKTQAMEPVHIYWQQGLG